MMLTIPRRRRSGSNQHPTQDKKIVPPSRLEPKKISVEYNKCITVTKRGKWTNEALEEAMDAIESGKTSLK